MTETTFSGGITITSIGPSGPAPHADPDGQTTVTYTVDWGDGELTHSAKTFPTRASAEFWAGIAKVRLFG